MWQHIIIDAAGARAKGCTRAAGERDDDWASRCEPFAGGSWHIDGDREQLGRIDKFWVLLRREEGGPTDFSRAHSNLEVAMSTRAVLTSMSVCMCTVGGGMRIRTRTRMCMCP